MNFSFLTKNILYLSFISFFTDIASELLYPIIPLYLSSIGVGVSGIGIIEGIAETVSALSKTYFGVWSDKIKKRKIFIIIGYTLSAVSKPLMVLMPNILWILLMRVSDRLGKGIRTAPRDALLSDETIFENKGKVFGFHRSIDTMGAVVGPFIVLLLLWSYHWSYTSIFLISVIPGVLTIFLCFWVVEKKVNYSMHKERMKIKDIFSYWSRSNKNYKILTILLIVFYVFNSSDMLLLLKAKTHGVTDYKIVWLYIIYNLSYAVFAFPFGMIADKIGLKNTIAFGLLFFGIVYTGISFFQTWKGLIFLFILYGVHSAAIEGNIKALLSNFADEKEVATAIGLFTTLQSFTYIISNSLVGWLWTYFNSSIPFILSGVVAIIISIILYFIKLGLKSYKIHGR